MAMHFENAVLRIPNADIENILRSAHDQNLSVYILKNAIDRESFFAAIRTQIPLDPVLVSSRSWDALIDSVSGGLLADGAEGFVIVWPEYELWDEKDSESRNVAFECMKSICERLDFERRNGRSNKSVSVFVGS